MKFIATSIHSKKIKEVNYAFFDIKQVLDSSEQEALVRISIINNELKIIFPKLVKKQLMCYYVDLIKLEIAIIKYIKKNRSGLLPPNYNNTDYDNVILTGK